MKKYACCLAACLLAVACKNYQTLPVTLPDGFVVQARVADTPQKQARGLMFVTHLPSQEGMLFAFDKDQEQVFWMKNTFIDLDMVFIGEDHIVTSVEAQVPHSYAYTPDNEVAYATGYGKYVLELAARTAEEHGVTPGAKLVFVYEK